MGWRSVGQPGKQGKKSVFFLVQTWLEEQKSRRQPEEVPCSRAQSWHVEQESGETTAVHLPAFSHHHQGLGRTEVTTCWVSSKEAAGGGEIHREENTSETWE